MDYKSEFERIISDVPIDDWLNPIKKNYAKRFMAIGQIAATAKAGFADIKSEIEKAIVRREYSKRSSFYPRGYYYPDPIREICAGNEKRGRLYKTGSGNEMFTYCFDLADKLSMVLHREELDGTIRERKELLINLPRIRIGLECREGDYEGTLDCNIRIEAADNAGTKASFAEFYVKAYDEFCVIVSYFNTLVTSFSSGLPVKQVTCEENCEDFDYIQIPYDSDQECLDEVLQYIKNSYSRRITDKNELEYDPDGYPSSFRWNGKECPLGHRKRPVLDVVYGLSK